MGLIKVKNKLKNVKRVKNNPNGIKRKTPS